MRIARPLRIEFHCTLYHVIARGNAREDILLDDHARREMLANLMGIIEDFHWMFTLNTLTI